MRLTGERNVLKLTLQQTLLSVLHDGVQIIHFATQDAFRNHFCWKAP